jgi:hypothetical protein
MSTLGDGENNAVVRFARLVFWRPAIVTVGMIVSFRVGDMPRRRQSQLFINMMDAMGRGEDQKKQERDGGTPTQAAFAESELFSRFYHFNCNPSESCLPVQACQRNAWTYLI